jgi:hypothetical protein
MSGGLVEPKLVQAMQQGPALIVEQQERFAALRRLDILDSHGLVLPMDRQCARRDGRIVNVAGTL